jgi:glycosyltransferase involved in cell wall biosynthesis
VILEAMAAGRPSVVSELDGIGRELIEEGVTGHVVPDADDATAVAAVLSDVLADRGRAKAMGVAARESAEGRFSMERRIERLLEVYGAISRNDR